MLKIINKEAQFIIPCFLCILLFVVVNFKGVFLISDLSYWSSNLIKQPHRILSYSFVHKNFNHLLSNLFGMVVVRYCFINLKLKNIFLFFYLIILLIPIQTFFYSSLIISYFIILTIYWLGLAELYLVHFLSFCSLLFMGKNIFLISLLA